MKIAIDPGHGGNDSGAVGPDGLEESKTVLSIAKKLSFNLISAGIHTLLTRDKDVFIELAKRCKIANEWKADYFVSVHLNSNGPSAVGIETLYTSEKGKALATPVQAAMLRETGDVDRGLKERDDLYVLNGTNMPAILTEGGFISHSETEKKLFTSDYQQLLADAMAFGILEYLGLPPASNSNILT